MSFFGNNKHVHVHVAVSTSTIPVIPPRKNINTKFLNFYEPTDNSTEELDDCVMSENNFESAVPTIPTVPTNEETIPFYHVNNHTSSQIEEIQIEEMLPVMNCMYLIPMKVE